MLKEEIERYYTHCHKDYRFFWDLDVSMAMHVGYWDKTTTNLREALENQNRVMSHLIGIQKEDHVLDAGCGIGGSSFYLAKTLGCQVTGITLSEFQKLQAESYGKKSKIQPNPKFFVMDFTKTNFSSETFSVVWAIESVCHAEDKKKFLEEAYRLLKPKGRLIIADAFQKKIPLTEIENKYMQTWLQGWKIPSLSSSFHFKSMMEEVGFDKIKISSVTSHVYPSSRRLFYLSLSLLGLSRIAEWFGKRTKDQTANLRGARYQYLALKKELWQYCLFSCQKP